MFCGSRKGVEGCALHLADALGFAPTASGSPVHSKELTRTLQGGVGITTADCPVWTEGFEQLFRSGRINVLVATSTMAAGVNLPARVVVVRDLTLGIDEIGERLRTCGERAEVRVAVPWCTVRHDHLSYRWRHDAPAQR